VKKGLRKIGTAIALFSLSAFGLGVGLAPAKTAHAQPPAWGANPPIHVKKNTTAPTPSGYQPSQIRKAYGLDKLTATGAGQTIAIVDAYGSPTIQNDLATFDKQFGLPAANLQIVYPTGKPNRTDGGWALETALDVEWAHAIAPNANILLVVAKTNSISDLVAAIDYASSHGVQVVSNSWGGGEFSSETSYDTHFQHPGTVYLASSGDSGAGTEWPAISPYVLSVGGTNLQIDAAGNYLGETGWSGSGGGTSVYESRPAYQNNWINVVGSSRGIPDVAWDADPNTGVAVYSSTPYSGQTGWFVVGGTSFGSPCWAAIIALVDQGRTTPLSSLDAITQLYNLAGTTGSPGYTNNWHDITSGGNGGYTAVPGYDLVTGIGSPKADSLVPALTQAP
jgi:subtilase family serine protease